MFRQRPFPSLKRLLTTASASILSLAYCHGAQSLLINPINSSRIGYTYCSNSRVLTMATSSTTQEKPEGWISLNSDKSKAQLVKTSDIDWVSTSQAAGVYRKMIERSGTEKVARATTIVKFSPNQAFPRHTHDGGEEFLVLDGVWRDDYGAFPKYSYVRNYIGSGHTPSIGEEGCIILVKLRQMSMESKDEPDHKAWGPFSAESMNVDRNSDVVKTQLFSSPLEQTSVQTWPAESSFDITIPKHGAEILVVDGSFSSELGDHDKWSWCRVPNETESEIKFQVKTNSEPVYVWMKEGHLASDEVGME